MIVNIKSVVVDDEWNDVMDGWVVLYIREIVSLIE